MIAVRILQLQQKNQRLEVFVRIFAPVADGTAWRCDYEIDWPVAPRNSAAYGVDSVQALGLALQKIGIDLYMSEAHKAGTLMWEAPGKGYGFPLPANARDLLVGDDKRFEG